jgi:beta-N-acetylhexosaminidase
MRPGRGLDIEPVFMMDEEGGRVTQIAGFFPSAPSAGAVSHYLEPAEARTLYRHMSEVLFDIGIDVNLAPCVDVNTEPMNPIIGCRAFGVERRGVEQYGTAFLEASRQRLACVAKHFPGHGMTTVDSHLEMPIVHTSRDDLETIHTTPFASAVRAGVDGIMVGHCCYAALQDEIMPASLSKAVVGGLLRHHLGFNGLVVTDSLDMDAVTAGRDAGEASRAALDAGADILLYTEASPRFEDAFETLAADLASGRLDCDRLTESVSRRQVVLERISAIRPPKERISRERYMELRGRVTKASVQIDDPQGLLPLRYTDVACVTTGPGIAEWMHLHPDSLKEAERPEDARGKVLLLWLLEPLRLKHSVDAIISMIEAARVSVLVTSYAALADTLSACETTIVTEDTSPETQTTVRGMLFGV